MNFEHTEDRRMLADSLNRFIAEQYAFDARDRIAKSQHGFSKEILRQFAELGVIGALFSEADGGFGGGGFDIAVVFEALGRGLVVEPLLGAVMVGEALSAAGSDAQKEKLGDIINGAIVAAFAHDEADTHYERTRVSTRVNSVKNDDPLCIASPEDVPWVPPEKKPRAPKKPAALPLFGDRATPTARKRHDA